MAVKGTRTREVPRLWGCTISVNGQSRAATIVDSLERAGSHPLGCTYLSAAVVMSQRHVIFGHESARKPPVGGLALWGR